MNIKEKLISLLMQKGFGLEGATIAADHLIANGVTIEKWIPVSEMLPEDMPENKGKKVINCIVAHPPYKNGKLVSQFRQRKYGGDDYGWYWSKIGSCCVTHWKPMSEPPIKQEESK